MTVFLERQLMKTSAFDMLALSLRNASLIKTTYLVKFRCKRCNQNIYRCNVQQDMSNRRITLTDLRRSKPRNMEWFLEVNIDNTINEC